jgi:hypothetical protein
VDKVPLSVDNSAFQVDKFGINLFFGENKGVLSTGMWIRWGKLWITHLRLWKIKKDNNSLRIDKKKRSK